MAFARTTVRCTYEWADTLFFRYIFLAPYSLTALRLAGRLFCRQNAFRRSFASGNGSRHRSEEKPLPTAWNLVLSVHQHHHHHHHHQTRRKLHPTIVPQTRGVWLDKRLEIDTRKPGRLAATKWNVALAWREQTERRSSHRRWKR